MVLHRPDLDIGILRLNGNNGSGHDAGYADLTCPLLKIPSLKLPIRSRPT